jgi:branched-chain amino acid transport system ATP-binding protein
MMLEVKDLVAGYQTEPVLRGVSFGVAASQILVMLGHNGAGKSSVVRTLTGLVSSWSGRIELDGRDITKDPPWKRVRSGLAVSFQDNSVFPTLSVGRNLELGAYVHDDRQRIEALRARVLDTFPVLAKRAEQPAWTLSGGERRMLSIGMALMADPKVLVLDEPSTGLSPGRTAEMIDTVASIRTTFGKAVLLIEQNVQQALRCADHVVVLKTGNIVYSGEPGRLSSDPTELISLF